MTKLDTKTHIANTARLLFNEHGFKAVTTAVLAKETGRAEGNIWYHFKNKNSLLEAITIDFLSYNKHRISMQPSYNGDIINEYGQMLMAFLTEIHDYRFLYRDPKDFDEQMEILTTRLPIIYDTTHKQFLSYYNTMINKKILTANLDQIETIIQASLIIFRYSLEISQERGYQDKPGSGAVAKAFELHIKLIEHLMIPEAVQALRSYLAMREISIAS